MPRQVLKSLSDKRSYLSHILPNNLQCLLICDPDAQKSSAAISVGVGSFLDPIEAQGLAHYLEHMLFMGTSKYPVENQYSNFLTKNSGSSNAYTSLEETNFYFEVAHAAFPQALDRFSRFFIDPLMLDSSSERQLNAVHSQHSKNLQSDAWRRYQLTKHLSKQTHPYHKFATGDKTSLANPNLRKMLFDFYQANYSSNIMKLVIYTQVPLDQQVKWVQEMFSQVKDQKLEKFKITQHPFDEGVIGKIVKLVPVKDRRILELTWLIKNQQGYYRSPPAKYVGHIVGHEGKGSLLSFLIAQGLATALSAGGSDSYNCYSQFQVSITLTDQGVARVREVIGYIFHFLKMLREGEPQEWVVQEIRRVNKMKFDFMEKKQGMSFTSGIAKNLHKRPVEQTFIYPYLMQEFTPNTIKEYLSQLVNQNLIVILQSKTFLDTCTEVEPIYQSKYAIQPFGDIESIVCNVALPEHNFFIPQDLSILPLGTDRQPRKIYESEYIQAFFKEDHEFQLPKAVLNLRIYFEGQNTAREEVVRSIFLKMLREKLRQFAYLAQMAQLDSQVSIGSYYTMNIAITGFRDSFEKFLNPYLKQILQFTPIDLQLFETLKDKQKKQYANFLLNQPYHLGYDSLTVALREGAANPYPLKLAAVDQLGLNDIVLYAGHWKKKVFLELSFTGNTTEKHSLQIVTQVEKFVKAHSAALPKAEIGCIRAVNIPAGNVCVVEEQLLSKDETNDAIIVHYQLKQTSLRLKVLQDLAYSFVKEPAFDFLRTKEQLGYIVMCLQEDHRGVLGMGVLVQSNVKSSHQLQAYVSKFINQILKESITALSEETFEEYKNSLLSTKTQKDKSLSAQGQRFWAEIVKHSYEFTRKEKEVELIPSLTLAEFKQFLNALFYDNPRIFEIHQISQHSFAKAQEFRAARVKNESNLRIFTNALSFKKQMSLHPDYYGHP